MPFWDKFTKKGQPSGENYVDPTLDLVLNRMRKGFMVDYDMKTWVVAARSLIDLGDGFKKDEWELRSGDQTRFLTRSETDGVLWTLTKKFPFGFLGDGVRRQMQETENPPEIVEHEGVKFHMDTYGGGQYYENGSSAEQYFIYWFYEDDEGENVLMLEQWGDTEFEAYAGFYVEEYEFSNILPGV